MDDFPGIAPAGPEEAPRGQGPTRMRRSARRPVSPPVACKVRSALPTAPWFPHRGPAPLDVERRGAGVPRQPRRNSPRSPPILSGRRTRPGTGSASLCARTTCALMRPRPSPSSGGLTADHRNIQGPQAQGREEQDTGASSARSTDSRCRPATASPSRRSSRRSIATSTVDQRPIEAGGARTCTRPAPTKCAPTEHTRWPSAASSCRHPLPGEGEG